MALTALIAAAGDWQGTTTLSDYDRSEDSQSNLRVAALLHETFVRLDYDWSFGGKPQQGSMLFGEQPDLNLLTGHWIDTFHYGRGVMLLRGTPDEGGAIEVRGSYAAAPSVDWGWRITIACDRDALQLAMFNIAPDGTEYPAVEADYARVPAR